MITGEQPSTDVVGWKLFSDPTFSTQIGECFLRTFSDEIVCSTGEITAPQALTPGTFYYLTVQNGSSYSASITYTVNVAPLSAEAGCSAEGHATISKPRLRQLLSHRPLKKKCIAMPMKS